MECVRRVSNVHNVTQLEVIGTRYDDDAGTTVFRVQVTAPPCPNWEIEKRYSEFDDLRELLEASGESDGYRVQASGGFPKKHLIRSNTFSVVQERIAGLSSWLQQVSVSLRHALHPNCVRFR